MPDFPPEVGTVYVTINGSVIRISNHVYGSEICPACGTREPVEKMGVEGVGYVGVSGPAWRCKGVLSHTDWENLIMRQI